MHNRFYIAALLGLALSLASNRQASAADDLVEINIIPYVPSSRDRLEWVKKWPLTGDLSTGRMDLTHVDTANTPAKISLRCYGARRFYDAKPPYRLESDISLTFLATFPVDELFACNNQIVRVLKHSYDKTHEEQVVRIQLQRNASYTRLEAELGIGFAIPIPAQIGNELVLRKVAFNANTKIAKVLYEKFPFPRNPTDRPKLFELFVGETIEIDGQQFKLKHVEQYNQEEKVHPWIILEPVFDKAVIQKRPE